MKKKITLTALLLVCMIVLTGCFCKHEQWIDADCTTPKTCAECGETEGEALGHVWMAATCETPKTCESCGLTEGEARGHSWVDATCEAPKTCEACKLTEGEALGHSWVEATTEAPKTCETCAMTEGERIITDERFTTAACSALFGKWVFRYNMSGEDADMPGFPGEIPMDITFTFENDGDMSVSVQLADMEGFSVAMEQYLIDTMYAEFEKEGFGKEEANAGMKAAYGMTVEEYVADAMKTMDMQAIFDEMSLNMVYYAEGDQLYVADSWDAEMEAETFSVDGDTLVISGSLFDEAESTTLTRVVE